jgi:hypothetical protein
MEMQQISTGRTEGDSGNGAGTTGGTIPKDGQLDSKRANSEQPPTGTITIERCVSSLRHPANYGLTYCRPEGFQYSTRQLDLLGNCQVVSNDNRLELSRFPLNIAVGCINGFGKTECASDITRYCLDNIPNCTVVYTSKVYRQCKNFHRYLKKQQELPRYKDKWDCIERTLRAPNGNEAHWFATKDANAVESFHSPFLVRIIDEAGAMDDDIIDNTKRWNPKLTIYLSSKKLKKGRFYESFTKNRGHWILVEANYKDCPWISERQYEEDVKELGVDSAVIKSMYLNEWSDHGIRNLISIESIDRCLETPPAWNHGNERIAGLDLSAARKGGDECVLMWREGNRVHPPFIIEGAKNEMEVVYIALAKIKELKIKHVFADAGGMGGPMIARMEEILQGDESVKVQRTYFGNTKDIPKPYSNKATFMWDQMAKMIADRKIIIPNDSELISQLTLREYEILGDLNMRIVPKEVMRHRGDGSPDRGDALALCLMEPAIDRESKTSNHFDKNSLRELQSNKMNGSHVGSRFLGNG